MQVAEKLDPFTSAKSVQASDKSHACRSGYSVGLGVTGQHVARVTIPILVREMRGFHTGAVGQESLEIRAIIIVNARLRDCDAIESDVTLTEQ